MMKELDQLLVLKKELDALRPIRKEYLDRIWQRFRLDWNYHSNKIEGNRLTFGETKALIFYNITAEGKPLRDHFEILGHNKAIEWVLEVVKEERPLTESFIRELHKLILKEPYEVDAETPDGKPTKKLIKIGDYKETPNHVKTRTGEIFYFAEPMEVPGLMQDLLDWYKNEKEAENLHPVEIAARFHYRFVKIHPFDDGNGRSARILMNFILLSFGYPPVVVKSEDKEGYITAIELGDAGQLDSFVKYIAVNLEESINLMIKGARGDSLLDLEDLDKQLFLLDSQLESEGGGIKKSRSADVIRWTYKVNFLRIIENFYDAMDKFSTYYLSREISIRLDRKQEIVLDESSKVDVLKDSFIDDYCEGLGSIQLFAYFKGFNRKNLPSFDNNYSLDFEFKEDGVYYKISHVQGVAPQANRSMSNVIYYDQIIEEKFINNLISSLTTAHLENINKHLPKE